MPVNRILVAGACGVANIFVQKLLANPQPPYIVLASRDIGECHRIRQRVPSIEAAQLDADNVRDTVVLIRECKPGLVINAACPTRICP